MDKTINRMMKHITNTIKILSLPTLIVLLFLIPINLSSQPTNEPLRLAIAGLSHDHVHWILGRPDLGDIKIVGIVEPNKELVARHSDHYGFSMDLVFNTLEEMIKKTRPQAVAAFGSIYDHLSVVEACAPKGVHVMVEKPLAVSLDHALKMKSLAQKHDIHLLTNYETSWYATNHKANEIVQSGKIGDLRKIVVHDGHEGPKEIGGQHRIFRLVDQSKIERGRCLDRFWLLRSQFNYMAYQGPKTRGGYGIDTDL